MKDQKYISRSLQLLKTHFTTEIQDNAHIEIIKLNDYDGEWIISKNVIQTLVEFKTEFQKPYSKKVIKAYIYPSENWRFSFF